MVIKCRAKQYNILRSSCKVPDIFAWLEPNLELRQIFTRSTQHGISQQPIQWDSTLTHANTQTDMMKVPGIFETANIPKIKAGILSFSQKECIYQSLKHFVTVHTVLCILHVPCYHILSWHCSRTILMSCLLAVLSLVADGLGQCAANF
jgi:hypothetical protein